MLADRIAQYAKNGHIYAILHTKMVEDAITIGVSLRMIRTAHKISRRKLAEATGISFLTIKKIEYGLVDPKWSTICTLFMHFNVQPYFGLHVEPISKYNKK